MLNNIKFTVIITTFNRHKLLNRCINSIKKQKYENYEVIIIDDSTNNITQDKLLITDERFKYYKNYKNSWVLYSRNQGLNKVNKTDYILFIDDDDYFTKNAFCLIYNELNNNINWLITNKIGITRIKRYKNTLSYEKDYLFYNNISWDSLSVLKWERIKHIRFIIGNKNWRGILYWLQIWKIYNITYKDIDTVIVKYLNKWLTKNTNLKNIRNDIYKIFLNSINNNIFSFRLFLFLILSYLYNFNIIKKCLNR